MKHPHLIRYPVNLGLLAILACNKHSGATTKAETAVLSDSARIDSATARRTALRKVPGGKIVKQELEEEEGRLVYSFDIKKGTATGIEEVRVDARDGSVVAVEHEDAAKEAAEGRQDSAASR